MGGDWLPEIVFGFFLALVCLYLVRRMWLARPPDQVQDSSPLLPCGSPAADHFECRNLNSELEAGQIYERVAVARTMRCDTGGDFFMVWLRWHRNEWCCGIDGLVAFDKEPPPRFVYTNRGDVVEVVGPGMVTVI